MIRYAVTNEGQKMATSNAQRQAAYRAKHLKEEGGQGERLNMVVDLHAKAGLDRLASCYGVTKRKALEMIIAGAERSMLDGLPMAHHDDYYSLQRNTSQLVERHEGKLPRTKKAGLSPIAIESIEAINKLNSRGDLNKGLAATIVALRNGDISPKDTMAINRATDKQTKIMSSRIRSVTRLLATRQSGVG
jgi:hypothetical protein